MRASRERLASLVRRLGASSDPLPVADAALSDWAETGRAYHGLAHLEDCLVQLDAIPEADLPRAAGARDRIEGALWYHDLVYDPRATDNEARSAVRAYDDLVGLGVAPASAREVARLIDATRHTAPAADEASRVVADIDLSILGRPQAEFDAYDGAIRAEYASIPDAEYRAARRRLLSGLLERAPLYATAHFRGRYEDAARKNLHRALERLGAASA